MAKEMGRRAFPYVFGYAPRAAAVMRKALPYLEVRLWIGLGRCGMNADQRENRAVRELDGVRLVAGGAGDFRYIAQLLPREAAVGA